LDEKKGRVAPRGSPAQVTRTASFEEMGRTNVELVFEILKARNA